jgi:hypothetical protein
LVFITIIFPPGLKLLPKSTALTLITKLITILVSKVVRLKMMT